MHKKIKKLNDLENIVEEDKKRNEKIVFTNGCFDLIHVGHIRYLYQAKNFGDKLIVAVNSDSSVKKLKGDNRPIINESERLELLSALEMIDYIILFHELNCKNLLNSIKPDIYVKGGDYTLDTLPEWSVVKEYGGIVKLVDEIEGKSTSALIEKIAKIKN